MKLYFLILYYNTFCTRPSFHAIIMAPSAKKLEAELLQAVRQVFDSDRANLTVNVVRKKVQEQLGLDDNFFVQGVWKDRSKRLIKDLAVSLAP